MTEKKSKIYTKGGDKGQTSLFGGRRVDKDDFMVDLYGDIDYLNSLLSLCRNQIKKDLIHIEKDEISSFLIKIQKELFNLSSYIATPYEDWEKFKFTSLNENLINELEEKINFMDGKMPALKVFIIPGGSIISSQSHVTRCMTRQVERKFVSFVKTINPLVPIQNFEIMGKFFNRLSDYFFVLGRYLDFIEGNEEIKI